MSIIEECFFIYNFQTMLNIYIFIIVTGFFSVLHNIYRNQYFLVRKTSQSNKFLIDNILINFYAQNAQFFIHSKYKLL